jgi:signal transduction histidine kinase
VGRALSEDVLSAAAEQLALLVGADVAAVLRHDADGATVVGAWSVPGVEAPVGSRDPLAERLASAGVRSRVESPILVDDRVWGVVVAATKAEAPPETEKRVQAFAGLVATAIANARKLEELERVPAEQAALRRLAALVARAAPPTDVFAAVAEEVGHVFGADLTGMSRYEADGTATTVAAWSARRAGVPVGFRSGLGGRNLSTIVRDTGLPARMEHYPEEASEAPPEVRALGIRSAVAVPITVEGRLWGAMNIGSTGEAPPSPDIEARLVAFTELVATAIANSAAREELRSVAEEQAALRRVATLVAQAALATEVFTAVVEEVGRVFGADLTGLNRFEPDETVTTVAAWSAGGEAAPVGLRDRLGGNNLTSLVYLTGRPARIERYAEEATNVDPEIFSFGIRSGVAVPVTVGGRLWGAISVASRGDEPPPPDTEARLVAFTELVGTAIANAQAQAELTASRARIIATADETRRRIERDLHDGAQQRLVSLALQLRVVQLGVPADLPELAAELDRMADGLNAALEELREYARGIHPAVLSESGLRPALRALGRRSAVPVKVAVGLERRLPQQVEVCAYYIVSEALANVAKHSGASRIDVEVEAVDSMLRVRVADDGAGGAHFVHGSGLLGLRDRAEAIGGRVSLRSERGAGTTIVAELPLADDR